MFLSSKNTFILDEVIKEFEVAYRSYVSEVLINEFDNTESLLDKFQSINISQSTLINSGKYTSKLNKMKSNVDKLYQSIQYSHMCTIEKDVKSIDNNSTKVIYVSELIDIIIFLANPYFNDLTRNFDTKDQFIYLSEIYKDVRNDLSHPASAKISVDDTKNIVMYISRLLDVIDTKYFWYVSKENIKENIDKLTDRIDDVSLVINNLNEVAIQHKKVIGREKELETLKRHILGEEGSYRTANSVVIYGYGGIGKTTLVVEFIFDIVKKIIDRQVISNYKYILFFTSKEEKLQLMESSGNLYIDKINQQITSYTDFISSICNYLNIEDESQIFEYMNRNNGIIVVDNLENLEDKDKIIDFIKKSPRSVQYIVTSRNEEMCEEKINILGFDIKNNGKKFIDEYIKINKYDLILESKQKADLIKASVGNTLILVTSLERVQSGKATIDGIIDELMNISSYNTKQIADFMYKNTFDQTLEELKSYKVEKLLQIIALYEEPIDLYAMSELTKISIKDVEYVTEILTTKLVLYRTQDLFRLNEFASKFIFSKILPDRIGINKLIDNVRKYKQEITTKIEALDTLKSKNKFLADVMNDWKPQNNADKLTIANAFFDYRTLREEVKQIKREKYNDKDILEKIDNVEKKFKEYELKTAHPYVKYQKARSYKLFLDANICNKDIKEIVVSRMKNNYEDAKFSVEFYYQYIKGTLSYAAFLWIYGTFLRIYIKDYTQALSILTQSKQVYDALETDDSNYMKMCNELAKCYLAKYNEVKEEVYLEHCKRICDIIKKRGERGEKCISYGGKASFDYNRFVSEFKEVLN